MGKQIYWQGEVKDNAIKLILEQVTSGKSVRGILDNGDREVLPTWTTFAEWLKDDELLAKQYAYAMEQRADVIFDGMLDIADNSEKDIVVLEDGREVVDHNVIGRDKLKIDTRKWILSRMNPKKYGDSSKVDVTSGGDKITWNEVRTYDKPESE